LRKAAPFKRLCQKTTALARVQRARGAELRLGRGAVKPRGSAAPMIFKSIKKRDFAR